MQALLDPRTLILTVTALLVCRAVAMSYVWFVVRQYAPVKFWAIGSALMAAGALLIGLRDFIPLLVSVAFGQFLIIFGWLLIDAGIVTAAGARPPWRTGIAVVATGVLMAGLTLLIAPDFALRTVFTSLPVILFDGYAALACWRARKSRSKITLIFMGALLVSIAGANLLKLHHIYTNDIQILFSTAWQVNQFYLVSFFSILVSAVIFTLLAAQSMQEQNERFRAALDKVPAYVYMKDLQSRYTYANQPTLELFGCTGSDLIGSSDSRFFPRETVERLREIDKTVLDGISTREEVSVQNGADGQRVYLEVKSPIYSDLDNTVIDGLCGISTDITALKEHERDLEFAAHYDALTRLPNRILLSDRLSQALAHGARRQTTVAVAFLDLDGFKQVNDTHGHNAGDALLIGLAQRMGDALRQGDTLARLGGDEFVAIIVDLDHAKDCEPVLERLLNAAAAPIVIDELRLQVSASIGITLYPEDDSDPDMLLRHADQAMYLAKEAGKNCFRKFDVASGGLELAQAS